MAGADKPGVSSRYADPLPEDSPRSPIGFGKPDLWPEICPRALCFAIDSVIPRASTLQGQAFGDHHAAKTVLLYHSFARLLHEFSREYPELARVFQWTQD